MSKLRVGDEVILIAGKDKGRSGSILRLKKEKGQVRQVLVEGLNLVFKHSKAQGEGIVRREAFLDVSKVAIMNPITRLADRVKFKMVGGQKRRCFRSNGEIIDKSK